MSKIFKIKKYWISTLCLLLFSLTAVAQGYSDETIGFDLAKETATLKKHGVNDQDLSRELNIKRKMLTTRFIALEKINKQILQNINSGSQNVQKSSKLAARTMAVTATDIPQSERDVLQAFYNIAQNKGNLKGWNFNNPVTSWNYQNQTGWKGVKVIDGHVTELVFEYEIDLRGSIPTSISQLSQLKNLTITNNKNINGSIPPEIVNLTNLETLVLYETMLTGTIPSNIGQMSALKTLGLSTNLMTGSIPTSIGQLSKLESLTISIAGLSGLLPKEICQLSELQNLSISTTKLSGSLPNEIGQLSKLRNIAFVGNPLLVGEIPQGIFNLYDLETIFLNGFTGYIPSSIGQLSKLYYIDLNGCSLRGTLPPELGQLSELTYLSIYNCPELTGTIPSGIFQLPNLVELFISYCPNLTGSLPNQINQPYIQSIYLNNNKLTGSIPVFNGPNLGEIFLNNNQFSSVSSQFGQGTAPIGSINLSYNKLSGSVAPLFQLQSLGELNLSHNELSGLLPANIGNVSVLDLSYNKFTGPIPLFNNIKNLYDVSLDHNQLNGHITTEVLKGFPTNLVKLQIQSNKFTFNDLMDVIAQGNMLPVVVYSPQSKIGAPSKIDTTVDYTLYLSMFYDYDYQTSYDTFQWYKGVSPNGELIQDGGQKDRLRISDVGYSDSGYYYCIIKNPRFDGGSQPLVLESEPILLNVLCYPQTTGTLNITSEDFLIGRPVNFSFQTTTTANLSYKWTFYNLDGTVSGTSTISPSTASQTYNSPGTYKIKLEVTQNSCITTIEKTFTVLSCVPITGAIKVVKPTSYPFQFSNPGNSSALACNETAFPVKFYTSTQTLNIGTQLYLNEGLTTVVTNGNLWYQAQNNATAYKIDANGKIIETISCSPPSTGNPSLIGFTTTQITDHGTTYPNNETFNWSNAAADISLSGANLKIGDKITIEFQVRSSFTPTHYYSVQYPNNSSENFTTLPGYSVVNKDVIYDGVNNTVRVNLAIPLSKIQAANTSVSGSIKLTKFNGVNATFKSGASALSITTPASGGITLTKS